MDRSQKNTNTTLLIAAVLIAASIVFTLLFTFYNGWWGSDSDAEASTQTHIRIVAQQFKWSVWFPGEDGTFGNIQPSEVNEYNPYGLYGGDAFAFDDRIVEGNFLLPKNYKTHVELISMDVIHAAYFPHFRMMSNAVPGMPTRFTFTPILSTNAMREQLSDSTFNYQLICNKICGAHHSNMKSTVVVTDVATFENWLNNQPTVHAQRQQ